MDIVPLANRLMGMHSKKMNKPYVVFDAEAQGKLMTYDWPGNVRELDNVIQRALILQQGEFIGAADLMFSVLSPVPVVSESSVHSAQETSFNESLNGVESGLGNGMKSHEFQMIVDALKNERGRKKQAAEKLGISPRTLRYKLAKMRESGFDLDAALHAC